MIESLMSFTLIIKIDKKGFQIILCTHNGNKHLCSQNFVTNSQGSICQAIPTNISNNMINEKLKCYEMRRIISLFVYNSTQYLIKLLRSLFAAWVCIFPTLQFLKIGTSKCFNKSHYKKHSNVHVLLHQPKKIWNSKNLKNFICLSFFDLLKKNIANFLKVYFASILKKPLKHAVF